MPDNELYTRTASLSADGIMDDAQRKVRLSFSSEEPVIRSPMFGDPWIETLGHNDNEVDLSRLNNGAPLLYNHDPHDKDARIGVVERAWLENGRGYAEVRISRREAAQGIWQDIKDGILRNVSVGYQISEKTLIQQHAESPDEYRVIRWAPHEISLVTIPADASVGVGRSLEEKEMNNPAEDILTIEQKRREEIRRVFAPFAEEHRVVLDACLDDPKICVSEARTKLLNALGSTAEPIQREQRMEVLDRSQEFMEAATDALLIRNGVEVEAPHPATRDVQRMSLVNMAETCLKRSNDRSIGGNRADVITRALHSTSDFPLLLSNVAGKSLMKGYDLEPASHTAWTKQVDARDFKEMTRAQISEAPNLEEVAEGAEYTYGTFGESAETYKILTYGRLFSITRQALINDDLSAFTRLPQAFGASARRKEADEIYSILTTNGNMSDGIALFHASHNNLNPGGAAALSIDSLGAARAAMRKQQGLSNNAVLNLVPRFLIVPAALETTAEQLLASLVDPTKNNDTPNLQFIRGLELVVDARLDADSETAWYLAASHNQVDTIERAYLEGSRGVSYQQDEGFDIDGLTVKARMDFGSAPIDWRGMMRNDGA